MAKYLCLKHQNITFISEIFLIQHLSRTVRRSLCQLRFCRRRAGGRLFPFTSSLFQMKIRHNSNVFFLQNVKEKKATLGFGLPQAHTLSRLISFMISVIFWVSKLGSLEQNTFIIKIQLVLSNTLVKKGEHLKC